MKYHGHDGIVKPGENYDARGKAEPELHEQLERKGFKFLILATPVTRTVARMEQPSITREMSDFDGFGSEIITTSDGCSSCKVERRTISKAA